VSFIGKGLSGHLHKAVLLLSLITAGEAGATQGLIDVYQAALLHDAVIAGARSDLEAGKEAGVQGESMLLPTVSLNASSSRNDMNAPLINKRAYRYNTDTYTLQISQPLYRKYNFESYAQSEIRVRASELTFAIAQQDLILRIATAYFDVLRTQDTVKLLSAQHNAIEEQLVQSKRLFRAKVGTLTELDEAQARFDQTLAQEIEAKSMLEVKQRTLRLVSGNAPTSIKSLGEMPLNAPDPIRLEDWIEAGIKQAPQIELKRITIGYMGKEVEKARSGHFPTLDLVASTSHAHNPSYFLNGKQDTTTLALQLNVPLYQGGYVNSKVREVLSSEEKSVHDFDDAMRTNELLTTESFLAVTNGIARIGALVQAVKSNESALHSTKMGREVGFRTSVDVLNAQQQLFMTKRDLSSARYDYIISRLKLKSAVGSLGMEELESVDHWLKD